MSKKIRVGLIVDSPRIDGWQRFILDKLSSDQRFAFPLVIQVAGRAPAAPSSGAGRRHLPWRLIDRIERELSRLAFHRGQLRLGARVDETADLPPSCTNATWLTVEPSVSDEVAWRLSESDMAAVRSEALDVIVDFGPRPPADGLAGAARNGVWRYSYAGNRLDRGGPPGFWDFYGHEPVTTATLQCVEDGGNAVIRQCAYRTFRFSWNENRRRLLWRSAWLLIDALRELAGTGRTPVDRGGGSKPLRITSGRLDTLPSGIECAVALLKSIYRLVVATKYYLVFDPQWRLYVHDGDAENANIGEFTPIEAEPETMWADPFPIRRNGKSYIFFEEYPFKSKKGIVSYLELPEKLNGSTRRIRVPGHPVIETPYHLSYPFLFEFEDRVYMIPETSGNQTIELWECDAFPEGWRKKKNVFEDISAADTTLLHWQDRWWMFTNIDRSKSDDHTAELHVFYADNPIDGEWQPHPGNPVVSDARRARMAGGFIVTGDGRLVRCCQALGIYYGKAVVLCEVAELTETAYREVPFERIEPNWQPGVRRTHHFVSRDGLTVVDGCWDAWKVKRLLRLGAGPKT
ncbi:MAG: glucosamine inositolphosphorylceramide transferase family protein [Methyloligellaceae bacterium]